MIYRPSKSKSDEGYGLGRFCFDFVEKHEVELLRYAQNDLKHDKYQETQIDLCDELANQCTRETLTAFGEAASESSLAEAERRHDEQQVQDKKKKKKTKKKKKAHRKKKREL